MPERAIDQLRRDMATDYSYLDVLALALAKTNVTTFTGDSVQWSKVVRALRHEYPELLEGIWFSERGYSEQLEDFFRVMARSGALSFANPRYERMTMSPDAARHIREGAPSALQQQGGVIDAIAERLAELEYN